MEKNDKGRMMLLSLANYDQVESINSLIDVGQNLERVDYESYIEELKCKNMTEREALLSFIKDYHEAIRDTNNISDLSIEFVTEQTENMNQFKRQFADVVLKSDGNDPLLNKKIKNTERFNDYLDIGQEIINATTYIIFNSRDLYTVSTLTLMQIIDILDLEDEDLRFEILKIVGRRNETKSSDIDPWLETIEYDYDIYHIKRILDAVMDIVAVSPQLLTHLIIYKSILTPEFMDKYKLLDSSTVVDDIIVNNMAIDILEITKSSLSSVATIMSKKKYAIPEYYVEIFDSELARLDCAQIVPSYEDVEIDCQVDDECDESELMTIKNYIVEIDDEKFKEYIEMVLNEYLELAGYFDR